MKNVYLGMAADVIHHGHINIIEEAAKHGKVMVGLLTDAAFANFKRLPYLTFEERKRLISAIVGVSSVVEQNEWDYSPNLLKYQPDYMVHGDDWLEGPPASYRKRALEALASYGGRLIEVPYTKGISSSALAEDMALRTSSADLRRKSLKRLLSSKPLLRFIEAHSPISALIAEKARVLEDDKIIQFDGFWSSSLTDSTEMGKPDIEALDVSARLSNINNIFEVTTKPLIMDLDTGGKLEHFELNVKTLARLGISAVIIEDKTGLKKNSLFGIEVPQTQENTELFCDKIRAGRSSKGSDDFMIIARIESLILGKGLEDALARAAAYVDAGVDGIMIHSLARTADEVFHFAKQFRNRFRDVPLICVPTSYNCVTEEELQNNGFNVVIYANHLMRASVPAMRDVALKILRNGRSLEVDEQILSVSEILELIPGTK